jgi:hypothetical protein
MEIHKHKLRLHGRLAIIGVALLDGQFYQQLDVNGAFTALEDDLQPPLDGLADILSDRGRELYQRRRRPRADVSDTVPNWPDDPLQSPEQDQLGRTAFARFLARRIKAIPTDSEAYAINLYGAWGAGKSSLLYLLGLQLSPSQATPRRIECSLVRLWQSVSDFFKRSHATEIHQGESGEKKQQPEEWLVVEFNAWRNQHINPPWWSLLDTVFQSTQYKLGCTDLLREYSWRLFSGRLVLVLAGVLFVWLLVLALGWAQRGLIAPLADQSIPLFESLDTLAKAADSVGKIIALIVTVWGGVLAWSRSLLLGSAGAAKDYKDRVRDPMNEIKERFNTLVDRLHPCRVAIFIDDLDRCHSDYVVSLLEGIQTLFREASVVYVVAADRRWLDACYAKEYEKHAAEIYEPGKSLGTLFLEKAFRFSTPMPGIPNELKERYWDYLLQLGAEKRDEDWAKARRTARELALRTTCEAELRDLVESGEDPSPLVQQAVREEVAVRLAAPEVTERLEHTLKPYAKLLEPNPRAMKRLVNAYSANLVRAILSATYIDRHQLVLWTILSARWPQLAYDLEREPRKLHEMASGADPDALRNIGDPDVIQVVGGGDIGPPLSEETIENCARLHA